MGFSKIIGQNQAVDALKAAMVNNRLAHAYLFLGPDGVGKTLTAQVMARALVCSAPRIQDRPCELCRDCHKAETGNHPDLISLQPEGSSRIIKIEQIRELQKKLVYSPHEAAGRAVVVPDAESMTEEASNCLLKVLEEPPASTYFILASSNPHQLLTTIRSRCQKVRFGALGIGVATDLVCRQRPEQERQEAQVACALAGGSVGTAIQILDSGFLKERRENMARLAELSPRNPSTLQEVVETWTARSRSEREKRHPLGFWLMLTSAWLRDILMVRSGVDDELLVNQDMVPEIKGQADRLSTVNVLKLLDLAQDTMRAVESVNANPRMAAEAFLAQWADMNRLSPSTAGDRDHGHGHC